MKESAIVRITSVDTMTKQEKRDVANWLKAQADALVKNGRDYYDQVYTGRYYTEEKRQ